MRWLRQLRSDIHERAFWIGFFSVWDITGGWTTRQLRILAAERRAAHRPRTFDEMLPDALAEMETTYEQGAAILEGAAILDKSARRLFGISGEEWLRRYDAGELDDADHLKVVSVEMLIPFARPVRG